MTNLNELAQFLDHLLKVEQFENDFNGIYRASEQPIQRLGLALEPTPDLIQWINDRQLDALFLHRPWKLPCEELPIHVGVIAYHLAFNKNLTLGYNPWLAIALNLLDLEVLEYKDGYPIGMIGNISPLSWDRFINQIKHIFGGYESVKTAPANVSRVAVVGAMTASLIQTASDRGADLYITGQLRKSALLTLQETHLGVITIGHQRSEEWGLRTLATLLQNHWSTLNISTYLKTSSRDSA